MGGVLLLSLLWFKVFSNAVVQYKFGLNYGQVFFDYSPNGRNAVNGYSYQDTNRDTTATDRGAFFSDRTNVISLPSNDWHTASFLLPSTFTINIWGYFTNIDYIFMTRGSGGSNDINIYGSGNNINVGFSSSQCASTDSSFTTSKI
jgi:hypothetical protein